MGLPVSPCPFPLDGDFSSHAHAITHICKHTIRSKRAHSYKFTWMHLGTPVCRHTLNGRCTHTDAHTPIWKGRGWGEGSKVIILRHKRKIAFFFSPSPSLKSIFWVTALHSLLSLKTLGWEGIMLLFHSHWERVESCEHRSWGQRPGREERRVGTR